MLKILPLAVTQLEPAFRNEAVRIREHFGVDVREDGCHADNRLQVIRYRIKSNGREDVARKAYPGWDLPIFVLQRLITRQALVSGNLSGAKSVEIGQYMLKSSFDLFPHLPQAFFDTPRLCIAWLAIISRSGYC